MAMKMKVTVLVLSVVIAFYVIVGGLLPRHGVIASNNDPYSQITIFQEVLTRIVNEYVDEPDLEKVRIGALRGLAEGLDPYCAYLTPDQVKRMSAPKPSEIGETGLLLSKVAGYVYVVSVIKDSPADLIGLRAGDVIEYIGRKASRDMSLYDAQEALTGPLGKEVELKIFRRGRSETFKLKLDRVRRPKVQSRIVERGMGYLKLGTLEAGEAANVRADLQSLIAQGIDRLILDLRGVATGSLKEAVAVANYFISTGVLARTVGREGKPLETFEAERGSQLFRGRLTALIDRTTAGAAEVIAAAILEHQRGDLVGERTFGVGGEQQLFRLRDGGGLFITTVKYASPSGKPIMGQTAATSGVAPTIEVRRPDRALSPEELEGREELTPEEQREQPQGLGPSEDVQLKKAIEVLRAH